MLGHYCVNCWAVKEPFLTQGVRGTGHRGHSRQDHLPRRPLRMALPARRVGAWELFVGARSPLLPACFNRCDATEPARGQGTERGWHSVDQILRVSLP